MFASKHFFAVLASLIAVASGAPTELENRNTEAPASFTLCTGVNFSGSCVTIPFSSDECVNLNGGLSFINKETSSAIVPGGFICTFFEEFNCHSGRTAQTDEAALQGGHYPSFAQIPGVWGAQSFNDRTSSIDCSPV